MSKIAYLFGAGASEGAVRYGGAARGILMPDITDAITLQLGQDPDIALKEVTNDLVSGANIEHLITLYEESGTPQHVKIARKLKELFRREIEDRVRGLGESFTPELLAALIDMHSIDSLDEDLVVVLTTNYEDLIDKAIQAVTGGINYVIRAVTTDGSYSLNHDTVPILKLHGSFNWKNEYPVIIQKEIEQEEDVIWIPPGVAKKRQFYPFDLIWSKAKELLECDVLRIIGSSMSMNDWELITLVHTTQKLRTDGIPPYTIEIIDFPDICESIKKGYSYLKIRTILEIPEVREYLVRSYLPGDIGSDVTTEKLEGVAKYLDNENIFALWLRAKGEKLYNDDVSLATGKDYFQKFILG